MINKVILVGNVGADPEVRSLETGVKMARIRVATTERIRDRQTGETRELTEWHTVILWRGLAEVVDRYVRKGSQVYIEGSLRTREWTERESTQKHYTTEIVANELKLLGRRSEAAQGQPSSATAQQTGFAAPTPQTNSSPAQPQEVAPAQPYVASQPLNPAPEVAPTVDLPGENPDDLPF